MFTQSVHGVSEFIADDAHPTLVSVFTHESRSNLSCVQRVIIQVVFPFPE